MMTSIANGLERVWRLMPNIYRCIDAAGRQECSVKQFGKCFCALVFVQGMLAAQECRQSFNVDPNRLIVLQSWDDSGESLPLTCAEAEEFRAKIFIEQLSFLSNRQTTTANKVNAEIADSMRQIRALRQELANVASDEDAQGVSATLQITKWLVAKTKLIICAALAADSGGTLGLVVCGKPMFQFIKQSSTTFKALSTVQEAQDRAKNLQALIQQLDVEINNLNLATIDGTATSQKYSFIFNSVCDQVRNQCLASNGRTHNLDGMTVRHANP